MSSPRSPTGALRLYRGLTRRYDPARVPGDRSFGTDFSDCPYAALLYASGRAGMVLVLDVPNGTSRVTEELWLGPGHQKRFMIWGPFDQHIVATFAAKELRAVVRRAGVVTLPDEDKGMLLRAHVSSQLRECRRQVGDPSARHAPAR